MIIIGFFAGFVGYRLEYNQRKSFLLDYSVEASRRKQREILNTMLPPFVVDQMINAPLNDDGYVLPCPFLETFGGFQRAIFLPRNISSVCDRGPSGAYSASFGGNFSII